MLSTYIIFNILNVIIQTIKSIVTIKCNKWVASITNAVAYGLYTYIVVLTASDLELWFKILVTALANLIGVFIVKWIEEKKRKDKLWKIEVTLPRRFKTSIDELLTISNIPHNIVEVQSLGNYVLVNCYCATQKQSKTLKEILNNKGAKYFVTETKIL